ncbi:MAG: hypothetical protein HY901_07245 [Deltaproteobacteria bacterium]|nr:hypothetical protein [Deltaproteobacteria bacterium]
MTPVPPCGLYRTRAALGDHVPAGRLVYFHNHGEPGPGIYLPSGWKLNHASFHARGTPLPSPEWAANLEPLPAEGLYRVREPFTCCKRGCRTFEADLLVQLGYDATARPLLFVPEWTDAGLAIPETGTPLDPDRLGALAKLRVSQAHLPSDLEPH